MIIIDESVLKGSSFNSFNGTTTNTSTFLQYFLVILKQQHTQIFNHTHTHTHIHIQSHTPTYSITHTYIFNHTHTHTHTHIFNHTHTHTYSITHTHIHIQSHTHTHTYSITHTHIHIQSHTSVLPVVKEFKTPQTSKSYFLDYFQILKKYVFSTTRLQAS